jgi:NADH:ubiquinone oxidoreductase subunit F (NADH-binding)
MSPAAQATTLPRLLSGLPASGAMSLDDHLAIHGDLPAATRHHGRGRPSVLIDEVEQAGLRGRGGAGFPTAIKMRTVAGHRGRPVVIANGGEGEPMSLKDRLLLERLPHLVLDGALTAGEAIGASEIVLCIDEGSVRAHAAIEQALGERRGFLPRRPSIRVATLPNGYVSSQESAIVNFLNGGPAKPTVSPVFERGVGGRPTLVDNVETLAHVALIARFGPDWFRGLGTDAQPGSALVTLGGTVAHGGVYEIEPGVTLGALIDAAGGVRQSVRAILIGGYAGSWLSPSGTRELRICPEGLSEVGAALGAGLIYALPTDACGVAEIASVARWMSDESAGQCGPCVHGLGSIAETLEAIVGGAADRDACRRVDRWCSMVARRGACAHPDGAVRFIATGLRTFQREFEDHVLHGPCDACAAPRVLPVPEFNRNTFAAA